MAAGPHQVSQVSQRVAELFRLTLESVPESPESGPESVRESEVAVAFRPGLVQWVRPAPRSARVPGSQGSQGMERAVWEPVVWGLRNGGRYSPAWPEREPEWLPRLWWVVRVSQVMVLWTVVWLILAPAARVILGWFR